MAWTTTSTKASRISQDVTTEKIISYITVATDCYPGQAVAFVAAGTVALAVKGTHDLQDIGIVCYNKTRTEDDIDEMIDISVAVNLAKIDILVSGIAACFITDQGAAVPIGSKFTISSTPGSLTKLALTATGATSGTALRDIPVATSLNPIVDDDTRAFMGIGKLNSLGAGSVY